MVLLSDGFESGNYNAWTGTTKSASCTVAVDTVTVYRGTYSSKCYTTGGAGNQVAYQYKTLAGESVVYCRAYVYISTAISARYSRLQFIDFLAGGNLIAWAAIIVDPLGTMNWEAECRNGSGYVAKYTSSPAPTLDAWHCVELYWINSATVGKAILYVDGTAVQTTANSNTSLYGNCDTVRVGIDTAGTFTSTVYVDEVVIDTSYIGPVAPLARTSRDLILNRLISPSRRIWFRYSMRLKA